MWCVFFFHSFYLIRLRRSRCYKTLRCVCIHRSIKYNHNIHLIKYRAVCVFLFLSFVYIMGVHVLMCMYVCSSYSIYAHVWRILCTRERKIKQNINFIEELNYANAREWEIARNVNRAQCFSHWFVVSITYPISQNRKFDTCQQTLNHSLRTEFQLFVTLSRYLYLAFPFCFDSMHSYAVNVDWGGLCDEMATLLFYECPPISN